MRLLYLADAQSIHARRWAEYFRERGHTVHIASFRQAEISGVHVHLLPRFGLGKLGYLFSAPAIQRLIKRIQPDVVHAHYLTSYGFLAALSGFHPLVLTAWGTDLLITPYTSSVYKFLTRFAVRRADVVTLVAEHMRKAIDDLGVPVNKIVVLPFGVDASLFVPLREKQARTSALNLICTRNHGPVYDIGTLLKALAEVSSSGLKLHVDLVGRGPLQSELRREAQELGISNWVKFWGHVDSRTLAALLAKADLFVSPALSDGNNVSLNEAMACECFPIATNIPANSQWISHGVNGFLYPPGDKSALAQAILRAFRETEIRAAASSINRKLVETHADWGKNAALMEDLYLQLLGRLV